MQVVMPGFEPGEAKPADLQWAGAVAAEQVIQSLKALLGDTWGCLPLTRHAMEHPGSLRRGSGPDPEQAEARKRECKYSIAWLLMPSEACANGDETQGTEGRHLWMEQRPTDA